MAYKTAGGKWRLLSENYVDLKVRIYSNTGTLEKEMETSCERIGTYKVVPQESNRWTARTGEHEVRP